MVCPVSAVAHAPVVASAIAALSPAGAATTAVPGAEDRGRIRGLSRAADGGPADGQAYQASTTANGRLTAFWSTAPDLVEGERSSFRIALRDLDSRTTTLIDRAPDGSLANGTSENPDITADGSFVVFDSSANNLVPDDLNGSSDVFLWERATGDVTLLSVGVEGGSADGNSAAASISDDGRFVGFTSEADDLVGGSVSASFQAYLLDRTTGEASVVSVTPAGLLANDDSFSVEVSADGSGVAFVSRATDLAPRDVNGREDVFVYDRTDQTVVAASVAPDGSTGSEGGGNPSISGDGDEVVFGSSSEELVPKDANDRPDVFLFDRTSGLVELISATPGGRSGNGTSQAADISPDGRYLAYWTGARNIVDAGAQRSVGEAAGQLSPLGALVLLDRRADETRLLAEVANYKYTGGVSPDVTSRGFVAFATRTALHPDDTKREQDAFLVRG